MIEYFNSYSIVFGSKLTLSIDYQAALFTIQDACRVAFALYGLRAEARRLISLRPARAAWQSRGFAVDARSGRRVRPQPPDRARRRPGLSLVRRARDQRRSPYAGRAWRAIIVNLLVLAAAEAFLAFVPFESGALLWAWPLYLTGAFVAAPQIRARFTRYEPGAGFRNYHTHEDAGPIGARSVPTRRHRELPALTNPCPVPVG